MYVFRTERSETYLLEDDRVRVTWARKHRTKRVRDTPIGPIREVEDAGPDKTRISFASTDGRFGTPAGVTRSLGGLDVALPDMKDRARLLHPEDERRVHALDADIEALRQQIREHRAVRSEYLKRCWRRARPVNRLDLHDLAEAAEADRDRRLAAIK